MFHGRLRSINTIYDEFVSSHSSEKQTILMARKNLILPPILNNIGLNLKTHYSEEELSNIAQELDRKVYAVGRRLADKLVDNHDQLEPATSLKANVKNVAKHLILSTLIGSDGADILESPLVISHNIEAIFTKNNPQAMAALREEFQYFLNNISTPAIESKWVDDPADEKQLITFIHNFLGLYPLLEPVTGEKITLPIKTGLGPWEAVEYQFERIDISPQSGLIAHLLTDDMDRMYAYGLVPVSHPTAEPYLLFSGTTFDVGQGVYLARISNITPGCSSGESHDMTLVTAWLKKQKHKVVISGQSQGGVLAMLTAAKYPDEVASAHCLNPTALSKHTLGRVLPNWCAIPEERRPSIMIYTQHQDPIFGLEKGFLPGKNTHIYLLIPEKDELSVNASFASLVPAIVPPLFINKITSSIARAYQAHGHLYSAQGYIVMIELNLARENARYFRELSSNTKLLVSSLFFSAKKASLLMYLCEKKYAINSLHKVGGYSLLTLLLGALANEALKNPRLAKGILFCLTVYLVVFPQIEGEVSYRRALECAIP